MDSGSQTPILMKNNPLLDRSFAFAIQIVTVSRQLGSRKEFVISKQLLKSGTSVGANIEEAIAASTKLIKILTKIVKTSGEAPQ